MYLHGMNRTQIKPLFNKGLTIKWNMNMNIWNMNARCVAQETVQNGMILVFVSRILHVFCA